MLPTTQSFVSFKERIIRSQGWISQCWRKKLDSKREEIPKSLRSLEYMDIFYSIPTEELFRRSRLRGVEKFETLKKKLRWEQKNSKCLQIRALENEHLFNLLGSSKVRVDSLTIDVIKAILKDRVTDGKLPLEQALVCSIEEVRIAAASKVRQDTSVSSGVPGV